MTIQTNSDRESFVKKLDVYFLLLVRSNVSERCCYGILKRTAPHCHGQTNQMGYIKVKARLPGIYGNVNRPCPRATPSDSGQFTAINPTRPGFNYYITFVLDSDKIPIHSSNVFLTQLLISGRKGQDGQKRWSTGPTKFRSPTSFVSRQPLIISDVVTAQSLLSCVKLGHTTVIDFIITSYKLHFIPHRHQCNIDTMCILRSRTFLTARRN